MFSFESAKALANISEFVFGFELMSLLSLLYMPASITLFLSFNNVPSLIISTSIILILSFL